MSGLVGKIADSINDDWVSLRQLLRNIWRIFFEFETYKINSGIDMGLIILIRDPHVPSIRVGRDEVREIRFEEPVDLGEGERGGGQGDGGEGESEGFHFDSELGLEGTIRQ